jgi:ATP-dependent DNA ligase
MPLIVSSTAMTLELKPPIPPMEALSVDQIPSGPDWQYEPKWDGFRCLAFRDRGEVTLQSKAGRQLNRYFPEIVAAMAALDADAFVLDGELAVPSGDSFSFDDLLQRIHPAASRVKRLTAETPAVFIAFDLIAGTDGRSVMSQPLAERRPLLERFAARHLAGNERIRLSPATARLAEARGWLERVGATLDGIIAKQRSAEYRPGERTAVQKIKNYRSADCVVGGFRYGTGSQRVGSLLLGLYDDAGLLHHVGFTSAIAATERAALTEKLESLAASPGFTGNAPGGPSRWSTERTGQWTPLRPKLVVEVCYDHFSGGRFRHGTRILRWRSDKAPHQCTFEQVEQKGGNLLRLLQAPGGSRASRAGVGRRGQAAILRGPRKGAAASR